VYLPPTNKNARYISSLPPLKLENQFMGKVSLDRMKRKLKSSNVGSS
jgi:hypothetical protein